MCKIAINDYAIVGITETWLQGDQGQELNIQRYSIFRRDRQKRKRRRWGSVAGERGDHCNRKEGH